MKKAKFLTLVLIAVLCLSMFAGCKILNISFINDWVFVPQQVTGSELNLSLISASSMEYTFNVKNNGDERELKSSAFTVNYKIDGSDYQPVITFDDYSTSISFLSKESKDVTIKAISTATFTNNSKIVIKYDGTVICEYIVKSNA